MGSEVPDYQRSRPYYPMYYDRDFNFWKDRNYWLVFNSLLNFLGVHHVVLARLLRLEALPDRKQKMGLMEQTRAHLGPTCPSLLQQRRSPHPEGIRRLREVPY